VANPELNPELRNLIDARLDAIEDVLRRARMPHSERRHIVGEVETQIFELLGRRGENLTREDVIAVLDSLDPPESYIPDELQAATPELVELHGRGAARPSRLPLLLLGVGLALVLDLLVAGLSAVGRELIQSENAREALVGITIVLTAFFGATGMVWLKRSKKPQIGGQYIRVAAVFPLLFVDYLFAVAISWSRANLLQCAGLVITCLAFNLIAARHFWSSIPIE
jgi:hypothetical protein